MIRYVLTAESFFLGGGGAPVDPTGYLIHLEKCSRFLEDKRGFLHKLVDFSWKKKKSGLSAKDEIFDKKCPSFHSTPKKIYFLLI